jgi:dimethylglycine dehydrogenase
MVAIEVKAVRERAGHHGHLRLHQGRGEGPDAYALLDRLTANRLPQKPGHRADPHAQPARADRAGNHRRAHGARPVLPRLRRLLRTAPAGSSRPSPRRARCDRHPPLDDWAALALNGPKARDVLSACTDAALDNAAFRWLSAQEIDRRRPQVWAFRMSYAGELGWELHMPARAMLAVYDALWAAGEAHGIADYGSFAMNACAWKRASRARAN